MKNCFTRVLALVIATILLLSPVALMEGELDTSIDSIEGSVPSFTDDAAIEEQHVEPSDPVVESSDPIVESSDPINDESVMNEDSPSEESESPSDSTSSNDSEPVAEDSNDTSSEEVSVIVAGAVDEEVEEVECNLSEMDLNSNEQDDGLLDDSTAEFESAAFFSSETLFELGGSNVYSNPLLDYGMYKVGGNSGFIPRRNISVSSGAHLACDYNDGHTNSNVYPIHNGSVADVNYNSGSGNYVLISHTSTDGTEFFSQYQHLDSVNVSKGQIVKKGETILGKKGSTGNVEGEHLHLIVFSRTKGTNINQWPLPQEIFDSNPGLDQTQNVEYTATPYLDVYIPRYGGNYMRFYNPDKLLSGEYTIGQGSNNTPSDNATTRINKTYRVKSTTTLGLNIRPAATTANTPLGTLNPGVTIACTKRTNNQINGYYWLYGTTSTGITGWITENLDWIEEVKSTSSSSTTPSTNTSTSNTNSSTTKKTPTRTVTKSAKYKAEVGLQVQLLLKGETAKSYKSNKPKIVSVNSSGLVTVKAVGKAKITIKTNKKKYTLTISTYDPTIPSKVSLSVPKTTIKTGGSITLTPVIPNGTNTTYSWKSSNKKVATVSNGVVTFKKKGKVTITCTANRGKKKAKVTIRVKQ